MTCDVCIDGIAPATLQAVVTGVAAGTGPGGCTNQSEWNQTFVLDGLDGDCSWIKTINSGCTAGCRLLDITVFFTLSGGDNILNIEFRACTGTIFSGFTSRSAITSVNLGPDAVDCPGVLDGYVFSGPPTSGNGLTTQFYDFSSYSATLSIV